MLRLPVSELEVTVREPTGAEDIFLCETSARNAAAAVELATRLVRGPDGEQIGWPDMCIPDLEAALLGLRQATVGDLISTDGYCPSADCETRVDIGFRISELLDAARPARIRSKDAAASRDGWWRIDSFEFRLPTAADLSAVEGRDDAVKELEKRCIRPQGLKRNLVRRAESAMAARAPRLSAVLPAQCPECNRTIEYYFDVLFFVLRDLRAQAMRVLQDVHLLAQHYKWSEWEILTMPRRRRMAYCDMIAGTGVET